MLEFLSLLDGLFGLRSGTFADVSAILNTFGFWFSKLALSIRFILGRIKQPFLSETFAKKPIWSPAFKFNFASALLLIKAWVENIRSVTRYIR